MTQGKWFTDVWASEVTRCPGAEGFDDDHPLIEDLKRKAFIASTGLTQKRSHPKGSSTST